MRATLEAAIFFAGEWVSQPASVLRSSCSGVGSDLELCEGTSRRQRKGSLRRGGQAISIGTHLCKCQPNFQDVSRLGKYPKSWPRCCDRFQFIIVEHEQPEELCADKTNHVAENSERRVLCFRCT